ncbi:hypothetical protein BASA61_000298 [Batrachochytrium salamandrivorans]|nr:hypothetical protein BASA61_000298 [Batrachochytrium salamandrivorans]
MRFFYLFTSAAATAVVSNAAVLPQWNNPSVRYSDHAPATSMVNIASGSHPPILAIQGYSGTLVSLMRRTPQVESAGGDGSGPGSVPKPHKQTTGPSREVKAAGKAVGGALGPPLIEYFAKSQKGVRSIGDWLKGMGPSLRSLIKKSMGKSRYYEVKGPLKEIFNKASNKVKQYLEELKVILYTMKNRDGTLSQLVETSHKSLMGVLLVYQELLVSLEPHLEGSAEGKLTAELLPKTKKLIASFTNAQQRRYNTIMEMLRRIRSYKYLGVLIDSKLDHSAWLKQKWSALEHTISALHPVLANHQLTVNYRSRIFSAVVMGKAYYGLELVGGNKSHLAPLQTTINKGIRLFTGARLSTAIGPLLVETGIGSLLTRSLVSRVRLLERSVTKRTPINAICSGTDNDVFTLNVQGQLVRSQRWFWSRRTKQLYRNRYWLTPQVRPKTVKQRHSFALMETLQTCGDSASLQKYVTRQLLDTSGFFKDPSFDQSRAHGTRYLMLARMDALWTARKAIQIGILVDTHPFSVDTLHIMRPATTQHIHCSSRGGV